MEIKELVQITIWACLSKAIFLHWSRVLFFFAMWIAGPAHLVQYLSRGTIRKMISALRRIFWDGFQPYLKRDMIFGLAFWASVLRLFTHRNRHFVWSCNKKDDQCIKAHFFNDSFGFSIWIVYPQIKHFV